MRDHLHGNTIRIQTVFRRNLAVNRVYRLCEFRAMFEAGNIMKAEHIASVLIQEWWRNALFQKRDKAATAIVSDIKIISSFISVVFAHLKTTTLFIYARLANHSLLSAILFPWIPRLPKIHR